MRKVSFNMSGEMKKLIAILGFVTASVSGQITWTKVWSTTQGTPPYYNGYHDIHYDAFSNRTWLYVTDTTGGANSIYSDSLAYLNPDNSVVTVGTNSQPGTGSCLDSTATWPRTRHPVGQVWIDAKRNRLYVLQGVCGTVISRDMWYYPLTNPPSSSPVWTRVYPANLPQDTSPSHGFESGTVIHDTDNDAFLLFGYDKGSNSHSMWVYCDTSVNPTPGTLTSSQTSVGCARPDDWTDITATVTSNGGVIPPGYNYPNLLYDSVHHKVIQFAGLYGCCTPQNQTWVYDMKLKRWTNMNPTAQDLGGTTIPLPVNSSANNEGGRVAFAFNPNDGKCYYHMTSKTHSTLDFPPQDWVYDYSTNKWTQLGVGLGPVLSETMTYDATRNALLAWSLKGPGTGVPEMWMGQFSGSVPPTISSSSPLPAATKDTAYSYTFSAAGTPPMSWTLVSGALPPGVTLSTAGLLGGTPTSTGTYTFSVKVANTVGTANAQSFSLAVGAPVVVTGTAPSISSTSPLPGGTVNSAYSYTFSATGTAPIAWSLASGTPPPGLSLSASGALSGTPTASGTYTFSVTAANSTGTTAAQSFAVTVVLPVTSSGGGSLNVPLTVQEALYPGSVAGVARTNEPFCQGVPVSDAAGLNDTYMMGLTGATAGQFRVLGKWPSGHLKWVEVCGVVPGLSAGGTATVTLTNNAGGNFGGGNLAVDNGATITVATGAATFTVRKANFNVVDQVVVGSTTVVSSGSSQGLVVTGPDPTAAYPANVTCTNGNCTTVYSSTNDPNSTCEIEKNGPVTAVLKCTGAHKDQAGHAYMNFTVREYFYKGNTGVKVNSVLRNADLGASNSFETAFKGHEGYELRIVPNLSGTLNFKIANHTATPTTGTVSGTDSVYLYQGQSTLMKYSNWCGDGCVNFTSDVGYSIVKNGSTLISGTDANYPQGWADISDSSGAGVEIGVYQLSAHFPKSLEFNNGGTDVRIGIWARQNSQPYYQAWPQSSIHDVYLNFHAAAPASPANDFLKFQHYLLARAPFTYYNDAKVFPYALLDPAVEDQYYKSAGSTANPATISSSRACCIQDLGTSDGNWRMETYRYWYWKQGGGENQTEFRWSYLLNFLTRGMPGRWLTSAHWYRFVAEQAWPHSDGFNWRDQPGLNTWGFPTLISANSNLATRMWVNFDSGEHSHWYGMPDYYFLTGDETIKDALLDGPKDWFLNSKTYQNGMYGGMWNSRAIGAQLMASARYSKFLTTIGDPDAPAVLAQGANDYAAQVKPELCVSGFPAGCSFGPIEPDGSWVTQGVSRTRGLPFGGTNAYLNPWCGDNNRHVRFASTFLTNNLIQGILELREAEGPNWPEYLNSLDLAYGLSRWALSEMYVDDGTGRWDINGFRYYVAIDLPGNCSDTTGVQDPHTVAQPQQTVWFTFLPKYMVDGDTAWAGKFKINLQRDMAAIGIITSDFGSYAPAHMINILNNPTAPKLNAVPISGFTDNGGGSYTISWVVPTGASSYRIKWGPKQLVDWVGFNPLTNTFIGDPTTTMPWFAATNVPVLPAPGTAGSTQTFTINAGVANLKAANFSVKAYIGGSQPVASNACDLNNDQSVNAIDVQLATQQALGVTVCGTADINRDGVCNVIDVQRISNAAIGTTSCVAGQ